MADDNSYKFIIAEDVATWVHNRKLGKREFDFALGLIDLTPEGIGVAWAALEGICNQIDVIDYSWNTWDEMVGNIKHTWLYSLVPIDELTRIAIEAVRGIGVNTQYTSMQGVSNGSENQT